MTDGIPNPVRARLADPARLAAVAGLGLVGTPPEKQFDRLARLAARLLDTPVALVNLVTGGVQFCKSSVGLPDPWATAGLPIEFGLCPLTVAAGKPLVVADAGADPRFRDNAGVRALRVAGYAAVPLVTKEGHAVGTLCAIDDRPRQWTAADIETLQDLATMVMTEIELRAGEQRLRGSEEHARLAVEVARLGTWRFDPATGLVEIDERMREIWGESPATALVPLPTVLARIHADDRDRVIAAVAAALDPTSTGLYGIEYRIVWPDGGERWVAANGRAQFVGSGADRRPIGFVGTALDIDERKRAEETLRESEFRFRQLADALPQIAWIGGPDGTTVEYMNRQWSDYTGLPAADSPGAANAPIHPDDLASTTDRWLQAVAAGTPYENELRLRGTDGVYRWFLSRSVPVRDGDGRVVNWFGTSTDIDAMKRLQEERLAFVDAAAHDLKNPLTALIAHVQLLRRHAERRTLDDAALATGLGAIDTAAGRTVNLIEELLDAAHIRAGRGLELRREPVDLVAMARAVAAEHGRASTQHAIRIESGPDRLVGVWDGSRLERVLANLIGNAIKFSPAGGEVVLRIRREDRADGAWAVLLVDDRGVGIPAADLPRVFDRFHRGANAAGAFAGTGIGLAGAKQIVEQHGGAVTVQSAEGVGSTFTVRLPLGGAAG